MAVGTGSHGSTICSVRISRRRIVWEIIWSASNAPSKEFVVVEYCEDCHKPNGSNPARGSCGRNGPLSPSVLKPVQNFAEYEEAAAICKYSPLVSQWWPYVSSYKCLLTSESTVDMENRVWHGNSVASASLMVLLQCTPMYSNVTKRNEKQPKGSVHDKLRNPGETRTRMIIYRSLLSSSAVVYRMQANGNMPL